MVIEVDADDADRLPEQDGILAQYGESQVPVPGIRDLAYRITDNCIQESFKYFRVMNVDAMLVDAISDVSERKDQEHPADFFY